MQIFVETMLRHMSSAKTDGEIETMLDELSRELGYRSAFMLDFPSDPEAPIRLWDSEPKRAQWWRKHTEGGSESISRSLAEALVDDGIHQLRIKPDDERFPVAKVYDFDNTTVVPVTFDHKTKGVVGLAGEVDDLGEVALSLQIVCYALLMQARTIKSGVVSTGVALTPREREVVKLTAKGLTSEKIADELGMSPRTVNQHIDNVGVKLQTRNRVHTVAEALRRHLVA